MRKQINFRGRKTQEIKEGNQVKFTKELTRDSFNRDNCSVQFSSVQFSSVQFSSVQFSNRIAVNKAPLVNNEGIG